MLNLKPLLGESWYNHLEDEFNKQYWIDLTTLLRDDYSKCKIYPEPRNIFKAFELTPPDKVKVVFISQDPYHQEGQAHGMCFSSLTKETPYSLQRVFRELDRDIFKTTTYQEFKQVLPTNDLTLWAKQGVLLLNCVLTVRANQPGSHSTIGWQQFTSKVLELLYEDPTPKVFVGLGSEGCKAILKVAKGINNHLIIETGHPASAAHGKDRYSGSGMFWKIQLFLHRRNIPVINWKLNGEA